MMTTRAADASFRPAAAARPRQGRLFDAWMVLLLVVPVYGTFYPPESYFATGTDFLPYPITPVILVVTSLSIGWLYMRARAAGPIRHLPLAYAYFLLALVSLAWSPGPQITFQRALRLLPPIGLGLLLCQYYRPRQLLRLMTVAFLISALASILVALMLPSIGLSNMGNGYEAAWRGALLNKNATGLLYALGLIVAFYAHKDHAISPRMATITGLTCLFMLVMANSASSAVSAVVAIGLGFAALGLRRMPGAVALLLAGTALAFVIGFFAISFAAPEQMVGLLGRDMTLTGRTDIWAATLRLVPERPLFGQGYAFWMIDTPTLEQIFQEVGYKVAHAHNSWLDLLVQLGAAGLVIVAALFLVSLGRAIAYAGRSQSPAAPLYLVVMVFLLIRSMTEVEFSEPGATTLFWLVWVAAATKSATKSARAARPGVRAPASRTPVATLTPTS